MSIQIYVSLKYFSTFADEKGAMDAGGYNCVPFSYGNFADSTAQKGSGIDVNASSFHPSFPVPEHLLQNLPPSEKVHQIIARTAMFVGQHGGQSEIVLRVKQGDNPTFGFLMPHHHLHPYFRYLVDHPEVLKTGNDSKSQGEKSNDVQASGALSLLGSIYGSGEDEDVEAKVEIKSEQTVSGGTASASDVPKSDKSEQTLSAGDGAQKDETVSIHSQTSKVKVSAPNIKSITSIKPGRATSIKSYGSNMEMPKASTLFPLAHAEKSLVDPPSEMKKLVDRIVEIILKNGRDFETVLIEQDKKHGKFPFLLPSNQYHPYYIRVLKKAQESRISGKTFGSGKEGSSWQEIEKDAGHQMKETECASLDGSDDLDLDYDKKDKFKMVIPKTKKDPQEQPPKESQQQSRFTVDATAAAAILQAATRGIRNPNLKIFSNKTSHDSSIEGGPSSNSALKENGESSHTARGDKDIAKIAAGEADTSDSELMRQQKLKAERLRRAKMFAAMIKSGAAPLGTEPPRSSSLEPPGSGPVPGNSGLADKNVVEEVKGREGSYPLMESNDENEHKLNKRRHYRSRKHDDGQGEKESKENEEDTGEDDDDEKSRSTKRHKSRHSSRRHRDKSKDRHKHRRRHSSSKSKESGHRHKHDSSSEDDDDRHHRQKSDSSLEEERKHYKRRHKHENSSEEESKHVKRRHKESSRKHRHRERSGKNDRSHAEEGELEEGEIRMRTSDQSLSAIGEDASREASVDASKSPLREKRSSLPLTEPTEVPDELRAKIRAMLLATM
ncbi:uncharacterized protein LOC141657032 isoform X4 [Silene latifolia]|uniref:uncharacterized protein LOC141657032 isoform X4 n=1 Tax=Silene latifolia TaxID=37657 RepID=UPI003D785BB8